MNAGTPTLRIVLVAAGVLVGAMCASRKAPSPPQAEARDGAKEPPLRVLFTGSDDGYLDACGCDDGLLGGLPRRRTLLKMLGSDRAGTILLSNGRLISGTTVLDGMKLDTILFAINEQGMGYDAIALTERELALGRERLAEVAAFLGEECPLLGTNLEDLALHGTEGEESPLLPCVCARSVAVGGREVLLLSAVAPSRAGLYAAADRFVAVGDPEAALERELAAHPQAWKVVVLGQMSLEEAQELARAVPRLDLLIVQGSEQEDHPLAPMEPIGRTTIATTGRKGKFVGRFEETGDEPARAGSEPVDDGLKKDEEIQEIVLEFYRDRLVLNDPRPIEAYLEQHETKSRVSYAGAAEGSCAGCHPKAWEIWSASKHAHAWRTLVDQDLPPQPTDTKGKQKNAIWDPDCVRCHVTGFGEKTGYGGIEKEKARDDAPLVNVSCEACHGPSGDHAERATNGDPAWPGPKLPKVWLPDDAAKDPARALADNAAAERLCMRCHDPDNSPNFDLRGYWQGIVKGEQRQAVAHGRE